MNNLANIEPALCRCCSSLTKYRMINENYFNSGHMEVYSDMIKDCFGFEMSKLDGELSLRLICAPCILKLREASAFKVQVQETEQTFLQKLNEQPSKESPKHELDSDFEEWGLDDREGSTGVVQDTEPRDDNCTGHKTPKSENSDDGNYFEHVDGVGDDGTGARETGDSDTRDSETKVATGDEPCINGVTMKKVNVKIERLKNEVYQTQRKILKGNFQRSAGKKRNNTNDTANDTQTSTNLTHLRENTLKLINNSNMLAFVGKRNKYKCYFCEKHFLDIQNLRAHSIAHNINRLQQNIRLNQGLSLLSVEISNLTCKKCSHPFTDLDALRVHLTENHDEHFEGTEHLLRPFKIENEFRCVICQKKVLTFMTLTAHMNCHSEKNVCDACGTSFCNRDSLRKHIYTSHTKIKCSLCPAVLSCMADRKKHLRVAHNNYCKKKQYCPICNMKFRYHYEVNQHKIQKHGAKKLTNVCEHCNKEFASPEGVKIHYKAVHLSVKKFGCSLCGMLFFTKYDKNRHEVTHGSDKPFSCEFCDVKFRSKDSVRRHLSNKHGFKGSVRNADKKI